MEQISVAACRSMDVRAHIEALAELAVNSVSAPNSRRAYRSALVEFLTWCRHRQIDAFSKAVVQRYRSELERSKLSPSSINVRLSAIRKLAAEAADNGFFRPELAAGVQRVPGIPRRGVRLGTWLDANTAEQLLSAPDAGQVKGLRDQAVLALLVTSGIRRSELACLEVGQIRNVEGRWVLADVRGKGGRVRTVPVPAWAKAAIDEWLTAAGIDSGPVFRAISKRGVVSGRPLTSQSILDVVKRYGSVGAHDLRRTYARLALAGGAPVEQIQISLGHASLATTQIYLGLQQDLKRAPCDYLGLRQDG